MMQNKRREKVEALSVTLYGNQIAVLTHYAGGKNILIFAPDYIATPINKRPIFTLSQCVSNKYLTKAQISRQKVPAVISNLLPEGALREMTASQLKVHPDNEFPLLAWLGDNLTGAAIFKPISKEEIPEWALSQRETIEPVPIDVRHDQSKFSGLAGVQMKFSSIRKEGRFHISTQDDADSWIIKTPSTLHKNVPQNEYTTMKLAQKIGINIPEIKLVSLLSLDNLPKINLPNEKQAFAIKRFDRNDKGRIHTEDFAQIFSIYAHDKYEKRNYEQIAAILFKYAGGLADIQQMARRLLANILLANGDAHLKNWTLIYQDPYQALLSPAYDIVFTQPYIDDETDIALNLAKTKNWYKMNFNHFKVWSERIGVPYSAIKPHLIDAMEKARAHFPSMLDDLPMDNEHKQLMQTHWKNLHSDFRIV